MYTIYIQYVHIYIYTFLKFNNNKIQILFFQRYTSKIIKF